MNRIWIKLGLLFVTVMLTSIYADLFTNSDNVKAAIYAMGAGTAVCIGRILIPKDDCRGREYRVSRQATNWITFASAAAFMWFSARYWMMGAGAEDQIEHIVLPSVFLVISIGSLWLMGRYGERE